MYSYHGFAHGYSVLSEKQKCFISATSLDNKEAEAASKV